MELDFLFLFAILLGCSFVFGFLRKFNELFYIGLLEREIKSHLPPGDLGWPIIGNLLTFLKAFNSQDPESFINGLISRYGKTGIYRAFLFGKPTIIVCAPETSRKVLQNMEELKHGYPRSTYILTGRKALHSVTIEEHRRMRRLTTAPLSGHDALSSYIEYIEEIGVKTLEEVSSMKEPVELLTETRKMGFKVITHIFMGEDSDSLVTTVKTLYTDLIGGMTYSLPINLPGFPFHKALKARKKLVKIFQSILDEKRACKSYQIPNAKKDLMGLLLEAEDEDGRTLEDEEIIDLLLSYLLAGHESSAHGILWTVIHLLENPHVLQKAKEEQQEIMKKRSNTQKGLTLNEIRQMAYLAKVIDETLRRTTLSMANFRESIVDVKLNGYIIPKGWKVMVMNRGVHLDPELHIRPKEFIPGRWDNEKPKAGSFLPFGAGARSCPGQELAKLEIIIFLHYFLLYYEMERVNPEAPIKYLPIPAPSDKCLVKVTREASCHL